MEVSNKINIYEKNGAELKISESQKLEVLSHWNRKEFVVIKFEDKSITILANELSKAISNATNF